MTREEAINLLKDLTIPEECEMHEAVKMAIQALEQEPCDAISREPFTDSTICEGFSCNECSFNRKDKGGCILEERVKALPSSQPQPKTAHWILHPKGIYTHLICDNCLSNAPYDCRTNYCPNCGYRMVEPQESEDI